MRSCSVGSIPSSSRRNSPYWANSRRASDGLPSAIWTRFERRVGTLTKRLGPHQPLARPSQRRRTAVVPRGDRRVLPGREVELAHQVLGLDEYPIVIPTRQDSSDDHRSYRHQEPRPGTTIGRRGPAGGRDLEYPIDQPLRPARVRPFRLATTLARSCRLNLARADLRLDDADLR